MNMEHLLPCREPLLPSFVVEVLPLCLHCLGACKTVSMKKAVLCPESNPHHHGQGAPAVSFLFLGTSLGCLYKHARFRVYHAVSWRLLWVSTALFHCLTGML